MENVGAAWFDMVSMLVIAVGWADVDKADVFMLLLVVVWARDAENWSWLSSLSRVGLKSPDGSARPPSGSTGGFSTSVILFSQEEEGEYGARGDGSEDRWGTRRRDT
jgi:hypothetical protein